MQTSPFIYHRDGTQPHQDEIFVFGSNLNGIHGAGAALAAYKYYGAIWSQAEGLMGRSYAIPTKGHHLKYVLPLEEIKQYVDNFCNFTIHNPQYHFFVTAVGCGYAKMGADKMAPLFKRAIHCSFPLYWKRYLEDQ